VNRITALTSFAEYFGADLDRVAFEVGSQILHNDGPDFFGSNIADAIFQLRQFAPQRTVVIVYRERWIVAQSVSVL
jgi:cytidine deaminase